MHGAPLLIYYRRRCVVYFMGFLYVPFTLQIQCQCVFVINFITVCTYLYQHCSLIEVKSPLTMFIRSDKTFYNVYANGGEMLVVARGFLTDNGTIGRQHFSANFWSEASGITSNKFIINEP